MLALIMVAALTVGALSVLEWRSLNLYHRAWCCWRGDGFVLIRGSGVVVRARNPATSETHTHCVGFARVDGNGRIDSANRRPRPPR